MRTIKFAIVMMILLTGGACFSQPGNVGMKSPTIEERLKMVDKEICQPLKLDKSQKEKVSSTFKEFFVEMEKVTRPKGP